MADIVDDFLTRLVQHLPDAPFEVRHQIESSLRQAWGGTEPYVGKRISRATRVSMVAHGLRQQKPLSDVFMQAGVGRAHGYELLKRK